MILWRLEKERHADKALEGIGASKSPGRWNKHGQRVVYCADHPALALLEMVVHLEVDIEDLPPYLLLKIEAPDGSVETRDRLPASNAECADIGSKWITAKHTLLLQVPSIIVPHCHNVLINPEHTDIHEVKIVSREEYVFDDRLFK